MFAIIYYTPDFSEYFIKIGSCIEFNVKFKNLKDHWFNRKIKRNWSQITLEEEYANKVSDIFKQHSNKYIYNNIVKEVYIIFVKHHNISINDFNNMLETATLIEIEKYKN